VSDRPAVLRLRYPRLVSMGTLLLVAVLGACTDQLVAPVDSVPTLIEVSADPVLFESLGEVRTVSARVLDQNGRVIPGVPLVWDIADPAVVSLDAPGTVRAMSNGEALVLVRIDTSDPAVVAGLGYLSGQLQAVVPVLVRQRPAALSLIWDEGVLWAIGQQTQFMAQALDPAGQPVERPLSITWMSGDTKVVDVDDEGLVTALGDGTTTVAGSVEGVMLSSAVAVSASTTIGACASFGQSSLAPAAAPACGASRLRIFQSGVKGGAS